MSAIGGRQYGVTGPLSTALPTEAEKKQTDLLLDELRRENNFEEQAETNKRGKVLEHLQTITEAFIKQVMVGKGFSEKVAKDAGGKVVAYGSYRLGVFGPGSDIDTLILAPMKVTREDYFEQFPDLLLKMTPAGSIQELTPVPDSFVPIIKFEYDEISIDLIFCRLERERVPTNLDRIETALLRGIDEAGRRSLNGPRVTDEILALIPQPGVFRLALRAIKLWAQRRAIYANIIGFPGGVAWAMLVARVCQLFPSANAAKVVWKFFYVMSRWQWPQPVLLKHIEQKADCGPIADVKVWNPAIYKSDGYNLMPIITPAYPSMCATYNITNSTATIIQQELDRGVAVTDNIMNNGAPWSTLFVKQTFFAEGYKYYLSVISASTTKDAQTVWSGLVESKVRLLVGGVERAPVIEIAHPFNKGFQRTHKCLTEDHVEQVKKGSIAYQVKETITTDLSHPNVGGGIVKDETASDNSESKGDDGSTMVYTETFYIGLQMHSGVKSLDLSRAIDEFRTKCVSWDKYDKELMALEVVTTRNFDLPDDVFQPGEIKPARPEKKKKPNGKKRVATDDSDSVPAKRQQTSVTAAG